MANKDKTTKFRGLPLLICLSIVIALLLANTLPKALADKHEDRPFSLTILHTNDLHAHDQSFQDRGKNIGGLARLGHLARQLHKNTANCLLIDAGDIFQGTPMFTRYQGEVEVEMLNRIGYDLYTIGNHEFDSGGINLAKQLARARFKVLNCNLDTSALPQLADIVKASEIVNFAPEPGHSSPEKVGFVGAITPDIENLSLSRDGVNLKRPATSLKDPSKQWIEPVREAVQALEEKGINKIVLVTHCGVDADRQLAENLPQVDAIIGGHSHTRLQHPIIVQHADGSTTTIVQTGCYGRNLGKLNLSFDKEGRVLTTRTQYELMPIDSRIPEDKDLGDYIAKMAEPLRNLRETILCQAAGDFDNYFRSMKNDSALGNLICDSFFAAGREEGTEITFENRGGIRSRIDRGPVTLEKVEELLPFDNHLVFATVSGAQIRRALEHSISGATAGKFLDVHGLKLAWDPGAEAGKRLIFAMAEKEGQWRPLQDNEKYNIAMTDYSFKGGEGYDFKGAENVHNTERKLNVYFKEYLSKLGTIRPECGNRIVAVSASLNKALARPTNATALPPLRRVRLSVYTADNLGVEQLGKLSLPLHNPQAILKGSLHSTIAELAKISSGKLKNYCVFVLEGERRDNPAGGDRLYTQVGSPLNKEEFLALFAP